MKITTVIHVTAERSDGTTTTLGRTHITEVGDNPAWERGETAHAVQTAMNQFVSAHSLAGTRPL